MRKPKSVLITDLDNTLFDWVDQWWHSFSAMLDRLCEISGVARADLIAEIAKIHQKHGTSEYSFLIEEIPSLESSRQRLGRNAFDAAIEAYRTQRKLHLMLFPGVAETLLKIKGAGAILIGYTESMAFYANYRIRRLGLDGVLDFLFCPENHVIPKNIDLDDIRRYPASNYEFKYTKLMYTPKGSRKPDPSVLLSIFDHLGLSKSAGVYVGDSLMKDVAMAIDCGVDDVWAKYGQAHMRPEYGLLQQVTHWTPEDVAREQSIQHREHVTPSFLLEASFSEILDLFEFQQHIGSSR